MSYRLFASLVALLLAVFATPVHALPITFSGDQGVPPVTTLACGKATLELNDSQTRLEIMI